MPPVLTGRPMAHPSIRPRRLKCGDVANPCLPVHHPGPVQNALPFRKRHLDVDSRKLRLPRPCRIPADCPVARSGRDGSRPTAPGRPQTVGNIHLAPRRHQKRMFSSLAAAGRNADLAPRHYRFCATPVGLATRWRNDLRQCRGGSDGSPWRASGILAARQIRRPNPASRETTAPNGWHLSTLFKI